MKPEYEHLPDPPGFYKGYIYSILGPLLPSHAEVKAIKKDEDTLRVFVFCSPKIDEELKGYIISSMQQRFGDGFYEMFSYTERRKFELMFKYEAVKDAFDKSAQEFSNKHRGGYEPSN